MPNITNQEAITFCNAKLRLIADTMKELYYESVAIQEAWNSGINLLFTNDSSAVADSAALSNAVPDGRPPIEGLNVFNIITQAEAVVETYQANGNAVLNVVLQVAVNGQPKF